MDRRKKVSRFTACDRILNRGRVIYQQVEVGCVFTVVLGGEGCVNFYMIQHF